MLNLKRCNLNTWRRYAASPSLRFMAVVLLLAVSTGLALRWQWFDGTLSAVTIAIASAIIVLAFFWALRPLTQEIKALDLQAQQLSDQQFNVFANQLLIHNLSGLAKQLRQMSNKLSDERARLQQRELLLDTVLQSSPEAVLLIDHRQRILMANPMARQLLAHGQALAGLRWPDELSDLQELKTAVAEKHAGLIFLDSVNAVWHVSQQPFLLNQQQHHLVMLKPLTQEIHQQEVRAWKQLIRVIGHELNNTLAPIQSLAFSGQQLAQQHEQTAVAEICQHIETLSQQLNHFIGRYLQYAKLPQPQYSEINWPRLINLLQEQYEFDVIGQLPTQPWFADQSQLLQLFVNLLKNAFEAGASTQGVQLRFNETPTQLAILLQDDAGGLSEEVKAHATTPFYTTKAQGSGIGLALCRDIAQNHGGQLTLRNHGQGLLVCVTMANRVGNSANNLPNG